MINDANTPKKGSLRSRLLKKKNEQSATDPASIAPTALTARQMAGLDPLPDDGDTFFDDVGQGLQQGKIGLESGFGYLVGETLDVFGANETGKKVKRGARVHQASAPESDGSVGQFIGSIIPSAIPSAVAISSGVGAVGIASMSALGMSSAGNGMMEYEAYKQSKGEEVHPLLKWGVGAMYGSAEVLAERYSLGKLMPNMGGKFILKGNIKQAENAGRELLERYQKQNPSGFNALLKKVQTGVTAEGGEEIITELAQSFTDMMYQDSMDAMETLHELPKGIIQAYMGGALMGGALGPLSYGSQNVQNIRRRREQGNVVLAESQGEVYEIIGKNGDLFSALDKNGELVELAQNEIGTRVSLKPEQFDKLLQDKLDTQEAELQAMPPVTVATHNGQTVQVVGPTELPDEVFIQTADGEKKAVKRSELEEVAELSPEEQRLANGESVEFTTYQPVEAIRDQQEVLQNEDGDFIMPGEEGYEQEKERQASQQRTPDKEFSIGSGRNKQNIRLAQNEDGSFDVVSTLRLEKDVPVETLSEQMNADELDELAEALNKSLESKGMRANRIMDEQDPLSAGSLQVVQLSKEEQIAEKLSDYEVQADGAKLSVRNLSSKKEVGSQSKYFLPKIAEYFEQNAKAYSELERVTDDPRVTEQNYLNEVARASENPVEIAEAYLEAVRRSETDDNMANVELAIAHNLKTYRVPKSDLEGRNFEPKQKGLIVSNYGSEQPSSDLAIIADITSQETGQEVTVDDLLDFIASNPAGTGAVLQRKDEMVERLEEAFKEVTGVDISPALAQRIEKSALTFKDDTLDEQKGDRQSEGKSESIYAQENELLRQLESHGVTQDEITELEALAERLTEQEIEAFEAEIEAKAVAGEALEKLNELFAGNETAPSSTKRSEVDLRAKDSNEEAETGEVDASSGSSREYSSTQINLDLPNVVEFAKSIPDSELYVEEDGYGRELETHVTALFGLTNNDPEEVRKIVEGFGEVGIQLGELSLFENEKYDVLKIDVISPSLQSLNRKLRDNVDYENDYPNYQPHVTVAYLKSGEGKKYIGDKRFADTYITSNELIFSDQDRNHVPISLGNSESSKPKTQKEKVKELLSDGKERHIKDVADELGILEPNVRRILGQGAKKGTFKRVDSGVYTLTTEDGKTHAYIEAGEAQRVLPRMVEEGKKFDMIFLDPAYFSKAFRGGNRNPIKFDYIGFDEFRTVVEAVSNLVASDDTHVYLMLSGAPTAQNDMELYAQSFPMFGFQPVGEGGYTKTYKDGTPVKNINGKDAYPERVILWTKSGKAREGEIPTTLNFRGVRPKGYSTEKAPEFIKALIQQSTFEGEEVLDPFAGSGVTGEESLKTGRKPTLIEKDGEVVKNTVFPRLGADADTMESSQNANSEKVVVMTEEQYLATNGAGRQGIGDAALHKNKGRNSDKTWSKIVNRQAEKDRELIARREQLRKEYREKVKRGEIRPPSAIESLLEKSSGMEELESVQASRRLLKRRFGIEWKEGLTIDSPEVVEAINRKNEKLNVLTKSKDNSSESQDKSVLKDDSNEKDSSDEIKKQPSSGVKQENLEFESAKGNSDEKKKREELVRSILSDKKLKRDLETLGVAFDSDEILQGLNKSNFTFGDLKRSAGLWAVLKQKLSEKGIVLKGDIGKQVSQISAFEIANVAEKGLPTFVEKLSESSDSAFQEVLDVSVYEVMKSGVVSKEEYQEEFVKPGFVENLETDTKSIANKITKTPSKNKPKPKPKKSKASNAETIEDFGEKIIGARKDTYVQSAVTLSKITGDDLADLPLSKSIPEPNYASLVEDGLVSVEGAYYLRRLREEMGRKPRQRYKLAQWVKVAENYKKILEGTYNGNGNYLMNAFMESKYGKDETFKELYDSNKEAYIAMGFPKVVPNSGKYHIHYYPAHTFQIFKGKAQPDPMWSIVSGSRIIEDFSSREDAVKAFVSLIEGQKGKSSKRRTKFGIYRDRSTKDVFIAKKNGKDVLRVIEGFEKVADARSYLADNYDEILAKYKKLIELPEFRGEGNQPRIGYDYLKGEDATPEMYDKAFGFRGVQFGNYVNQGERQQHMNEAYNALMDLASILGIPSRAISLSGELGLAFGARGRGGKNAASAHYERGQIVINLTKNNGPGTLAHEWWHALDNYFSRLGGKAGQYITDRPYGTTYNTLRPEVVEAFRQIRQVIKESELPKRSAELDKRRTKAYFNTIIEMTARSFESYVRDRLSAADTTNDYLVNFTKSEAYQDFAMSLVDGGSALKSYPYLLDDEIKVIGKAYDNLFKAIRTQEKEGGVVAMYRKAPPVARVQSVEAIASHVEGLIANWKSKSIIQVARSFDELPWIVQQSMKNSNLNIEGVFLDGKVYINAFNIASKKEGERTLMHEMVGHFGIRAMLQELSSNEAEYNKRYNELMGEVYDSFNEDVIFKRIVRRYKYDLRKPDHRNKASEEFLAHLAEDGAELSIMDKVKKFIDDVLKALGLKLKLTKHQVMGMLADAYRFVDSEISLYADGSIMRQAYKKPTPIFYSRLVEVLDTKLPGKGTSQSYLQAIDGFARKGEFKKEELAWTGLVEWLEEQEGKLSREDVIQFVQENNVQIQEVMKGGEGRTLQWNETEDKDGKKAYVADAFEQFGLNVKPIYIRETPEEVGSKYVLESDGLPEVYSDSIESLKERANRELNKIKGDDTKYSNYTMQGGEDYRELLLVLPNRIVKRTKNEVEPDASLEDFQLEETVTRERDIDYRNSHWSEPNVLAHIRFNSRGNTLFIEEIQSDWHQEGRKKGYKGVFELPDDKGKIIKNLEGLSEEERSRVISKAKIYLEKDYNENPDKYSWVTRIEDETGFRPGRFYPRPTEADIERYLNENPLWNWDSYYIFKESAKKALDIDNFDDWLIKAKENRRKTMSEFEESNKVPNAPFKTTWHELAMKRMIRYAVENGFDRVAWTPGSVQNERYDLSKQVDSIDYVIDPQDGNYNITAYRDDIDILNKSLREDQLEEFVGKEIAQKMINREGDKVDGWHHDIDDRTGMVLNDGFATEVYSLRGMHLKVGGSGMKGFYDKMLPRFVGKYVKKWGSKVEPMEINDGGAFGKLKVGVHYELDGKAITLQSPVLLNDAPAFRNGIIESEKIVKRKTGDAKNVVIRVYNGVEAKQFNSAEQALKYIDSHETGTKALSFPITDSMRNSVMLAGQPMFKGDNQSQKNFDRWFGDSKVVDNDGNPLRVYHGTGASFNEFSKEKGGSGAITGNPIAKYGFFFSDNPQTASEYADNATKYEGGQGNVMPVFLSIQNPFVMDMWKDFGEFTNNQGIVIDSKIKPFIDGLKQKGYDGIILKGGESYTEYMAFEATQIKSATANNGGYRTDSPNIMFRITEPLEETTHQYEKKADWLIRRYQNKFIDGKRIQEGAVADGGRVEDKSDFTQDEENHYGRIEHLKEHVEKQFQEPLIKEMRELYRKKGVKYDDLRKYLYANHAPERNAYLLETNPDGGDSQSGMSDQQAEQVMQELSERGILGDLKKVSQYVYGITDHTLKAQMIGGLISKAQFGARRKMFEHYVPLRGFADLMDIDPTIYAGNEKMEGRSSEAGDILAYVMAMSDTAIIASEKNRVRQVFLEFVKQNYQRSDLFKIQNVYWKKTGEIDPETGREIYLSTFEKPTPEQLLDGSVKKHLDAKKEQMLWKEATNEFKRDIIKVMVDGRAVAIEVTSPHIARAFKEMDVEGIPRDLATTALAVRWLRNVVTQYSPEFALRNLIRDSWTGLINLSIDTSIAEASKVVNPVAYAGAFKALRHYYRNDEFPDTEWGKALKAYMRHGAVTGYWQLNAIKKRTKTLKNEIERGTFFHDPVRGTMAGGKALLNFLDDYNRTIENIARLSAFKHLYYDKVTNPKTGKPFTVKQAANYARNLTVNFNQKGNRSGVWGNVYLFFNASVQGISRQFRPFFSENTSVRRKAYAAPFLLGATSFMWNELLRNALGKDEDEEWKYDKISDWTRHHNIIIPNFFSEDEDDYFKIPLPYGYNTYWAAGDVANRIANGSADLADGVLELGALTVDAYNPIGTSSGESFGEATYKSFLPTVLKPGFELVSNKDFAGNPIKPEPYPFSVEPPNSQQFYTHSPSWAKKTAQALNKWTGGDEFTEGMIDISPEHIEYAFDFVTGGPGKFVDGLASTAENIYDQATGMERMELYDIYDVPFARSMYGKISKGVVREQFIENRLEIENLYSDYVAYYETGQIEKAEQFADENEKMLLLNTMLAGVKSEMRALNAQRSALYEQKAENDTKQIRDELRNLADAQYGLYLEFNRMVNEAKGKANRKSVLQRITGGSDE